MTQLPEEDGDADDDMDVANITLVRIGGRIKIYSKGDGAFGHVADELVTVLAGMLKRSGLWSARPATHTPGLTRRRKTSPHRRRGRENDGAVV